MDFSRLLRCNSCPSLIKSQDSRSDNEKERDKARIDTVLKQLAENPMLPSYEAGFYSGASNAAPDQTSIQILQKIHRIFDASDIQKIRLLIEGCFLTRRVLVRTDLESFEQGLLFGSPFQLEYHETGTFISKAIRVGLLESDREALVELEAEGPPKIWGSVENKGAISAVYFLLPPSKTVQQTLLPRSFSSPAFD